MGKPEAYLDFVSPNEIRIKGHRIGIEHVLFAHLDQGMQTDDLLSRFPTLSSPEIGAVLTYYRQHRAEVDAYLRMWREHEDAVFREADSNPLPAVRRLRDLKARLVAEGKLPSEALRHG